MIVNTNKYKDKVIGHWLLVTFFKFRRNFNRSRCGWLTGWLAGCLVLCKDVDASKYQYNDNVATKVMPGGDEGEKKEETAESREEAKEQVLQPDLMT